MTIRQLTIDGRLISDSTDCYVIAEIGHNHQGNVETCKKLFQAAKECGANAVKLQKRDNVTLFTRAMYNKPYNSENAYGATYGAHREALEFGWEQHVELKEYAKQLGITFFSTAFDFKSADFLAKLDIPAYKIASGDLKNVPLLKHVARLGKPMVVSTGGGDMEDVQRAYDAIMPINTQLTILQCTAGYPAKFDELDLNVVTTFRAAFPDIVIGLSSHDNGIAMAVAAFVLGARVVEKHFTLNRAWKGTDHAFSLEPTGLRKMVRDLQRTREALGNPGKKQHPSEREPLIKMGKKVVAARDLFAGQTLQREDLCLKSPGDGLPPYTLDSLLGTTVQKTILEDEPISLEALSQVQEGVLAGLSPKPSAGRAPQPNA